jgi:hypothetical protein
MRFALALFALLLLGLPAGAAGPSKDYVAQTSTRCVMVNGCRHQRNVAVGHARQFCQAEGGVKKGDRTSDYRCEQRGIVCVITGRIECHGRVDPTGAPGENLQVPSPGGTLQSGARKPPVCLDAECESFIDYAPGHREQGVHACRGGYAMTGVGGATGDIVCRRQPARFVESMIDLSTVRHGLHTCPSGQVMIGLSDDRSRLLCARFAAKVGGEIVQKERLELGLQVCEERNGVPYFLTGIDGARRAISCAPVRP